MENSTFRNQAPSRGTSLIAGESQNFWARTLRTMQGLRVSSPSSLNSQEQSGDSSSTRTTKPQRALWLKNTDLNCSKWRGLWDKTGLCSASSLWLTSLSLRTRTTSNASSLRNAKPSPFWGESDKSSTDCLKVWNTMNSQTHSRAGSSQNTLLFQSNNDHLQWFIDNFMENSFDAF